MSRKIRLPSLIVLLTGGWSMGVLGQSTTETVSVINSHPASAPRPALKYRLVPERRSLVPGNAAIFYHRAMQMYGQARTQLTNNPSAPAKGSKLSSDEQVSRWIEGPISEIALPVARQLLDSHANTLREIELGSKRQNCDWEFDLRSDGFNLVLPEIHEMRSLARLVSLKIRVAILDAKIDEAARWIEIGLGMGRQVSDGPFAIQALVGVAINFIMVHCLEELIREPQTPSFYWALADRPRPFIDLRHALEGERYLIEKELPVLKEVNGEPWSLEQARHVSDELQQKLFTLLGGTRVSEISITIPPNMSAFARQLGIAAMTAKIYPTARQSLIAQGRPQARVDAMPVVQVALLATQIEYERTRDERFKWMNLPYWQSYYQIDRGMIATVEEKMANPFLYMLELLTPALNSFRLSALRLDRQLDALQCIEAIRLYASAHGGKLPTSLEEMTDTPVPFDVLTGKPFSYEPEEDHATLSAPAPPGGPYHHSFKIHYVLKLKP